MDISMDLSMDIHIHGNPGTHTHNSVSRSFAIVVCVVHFLVYK